MLIYYLQYCIRITIMLQLCQGNNNRFEQKGIFVSSWQYGQLLCCSRCIFKNAKVLPRGNFRLWLFTYRHSRPLRYRNKRSHCKRWQLFGKSFKWCKSRTHKITWWIIFLINSLEKIMFKKLQERKQQQYEEYVRMRNAERERLYSLPEKELMVETLLEIRDLNNKIDDLKRTVILYSNLNGN